MPGLHTAQRAYPVTPSDTLTPTGNPPSMPNGPCEALYIGVGGVLVFKPFDASQPGGQGLTTITQTVIAGNFPLKVAAVLATSTTASSILALY